MLQVEQPKPTLCHHHGFAECAVPSPTSHTYLEGPLQLLSFALAALARSVGKKKKGCDQGTDPSPSVWAQGLGTTGGCSSGATPHLPVQGGGRQVAVLMLWSRKPSSAPLQLGLG